nr:MAG TPA: putative tail-component [Caudoviricetes sp.]
MNLLEHIKHLQAAQAALPEILSDAARSATLRAVEAAQDKTPPTAGSLSGTNTRTGELKQHWATDSKTQPGLQGAQYITELNNNMEYASYVNDGHRMDRHFVPGLYANPYTGMLEYDPARRDEVGMMVGTKTTYIEGLHMSDAGIEAYRNTVKIEAEKAVHKLGEMLK